MWIEAPREEETQLLRSTKMETEGECRDPRRKRDCRDGGFLTVDRELHSRDCKKTMEGFK